MSNALNSKSVASASSKAKYDLYRHGDDPRRSTADTRKRYHKALRRAVRRFIIESVAKRN